MDIGIVSLFPDMFQALDYGVIGQAMKRDQLRLHRFNPRDFSDDKHGQVDDRPYGGGPGMVMMAPPLSRCLGAAKQALPQAKVIFVTPKGQVFKQQHAAEFATRRQVIFLAGRYEGVDQRLIDTCVDEEWSLGDVVLSGGEIPIMAMIDATARLLPGVLGDEMSAQCDSFTTGMLDHPHYTRPQEYAGVSVPEVLCSGHHQEIAAWRLYQAVKLTWQRRPDLLAQANLAPEIKAVLEDVILAEQR